MASEAMDVWLLVLKESRKSRFDSYSVLIISHITFRAFSKQLYAILLLQRFLVYTAQLYCTYKTTSKKTRKSNPRSDQQSL